MDLRCKSDKEKNIRRKTDVPVKAEITIKRFLASSNPLSCNTTNALSFLHLSMFI